MVASERPQERLEQYGADALSDREILAMILRSGPKGVDVLTLSGQLIDQAGSLSNLLRWSAEDFQKIHGIGTVKALQLLAVMSFAKRILKEDDGKETCFDSPEVVVRHFHTLVAGLEVEKFWVLCLNRKNRLLRRVESTSRYGHQFFSSSPGNFSRSHSIRRCRNHRSPQPSERRSRSQPRRYSRHPSVARSSKGDRD